MIRTGAVRRVRAQEAGTALICALTVTMLLSILGGALVMLLTTERVIGSHHRAAQDALYAADAGIERAAGLLRGVADWNTVLVSACEGPAAALCDRASPRKAGDGTRLDLLALTTEKRAESAARYGDRGPVWSLMTYAPLDRLLSVAPIPAPPYVIVWVGDDADDPDGDPMRDTNGVLVVRAEGFGASGARRSVEVLVARERSGVRLVNWREVR